MFDQYVKTRAEEERKEKKNKLMQAKDEFRRMMEEAKFTPRYFCIFKVSIDKLLSTLLQHYYFVRISLQIVVFLFISMSKKYHVYVTFKQ